jgi:hypoxanthine-DNA glycosylase
MLVDYGIALWDVLAESVRTGSMDANIQLDTSAANYFVGFFERHRDIELICFNGQKAAQIFQRIVELDDGGNSRQFETLPSTSPAYASMSYADKLARWRKVIA